MNLKIKSMWSKPISTGNIELVSISSVISFTRPPAVAKLDPFKIKLTVNYTIVVLTN